MPTDNPRFSITVEPELDEEIKNYWHSTKAKNKTQAVVSLIEKGLNNLSKDQIKKSPVLKSTEDKEIISLDETNALLVKMGYIREGAQLSLTDLAFLEHIGGLMDAWFSRKA